jgi:hypothetical protein
MGAVIAVPLLMFASMLWAFFKFPPLHDNKKQVRVFNAMALGLYAALGALWYLKMTIMLEAAGLTKYNGLLGLGAPAGFGVVWFGAFFLMRNFWIFRDKSYRPGIF